MHEKWPRKKTENQRHTLKKVFIWNTWLGVLYLLGLVMFYPSWYLEGRFYIVLSGCIVSRYIILLTIYKYTKILKSTGPRQSVFSCAWSYICVCFCHTPWPDEKRYRPDIWHTCSHWPYLKTVFFYFFDQITVTAASLEKLPCHVDFPHTSSIALFTVFPPF